MAHRNNPVILECIRELPDDPADDGPDWSPRTDDLRRIAFTYGLSREFGPDPSRDADWAPWWNHELLNACGGGDPADAARAILLAACDRLRHQADRGRTNRASRS